jgi:glycerol-3-phosphate O-acyltransferase
MLGKIMKVFVKYQNIECRKDNIDEHEQILIYCHKSGFQLVSTWLISENLQDIITQKQIPGFLISCYDIYWTCG